MNKIVLRTLDKLFWDSLSLILFLKKVLYLFKIKWSIDIITLLIRYLYKQFSLTYSIIIISFYKYILYLNYISFKTLRIQNQNRPYIKLKISSGKGSSRILNWQKIQNRNRLDLKLEKRFTIATGLILNIGSDRSLFFNQCF